MSFHAIECRFFSRIGYARLSYSGDMTYRGDDVTRLGRHIAGGLFGLVIGFQIFPAFAAQCGGDFDAWVATFQREAVGKGISQRTAAALSNVTPDPQVLALDRRQGHFKRSFEEFGLPRINQRIDKARSLMKQHAALLSRIEQQYGVPGAVVIAIWGLETGFRRQSGQAIGAALAGYAGA